MPPPRRYRYDERAGRYGLAGNRGRFVSQREIRGALDGALERGGQTTRRLTEQLRAREITLAEWQLAMAREIKSATMAGLASAHGGFAQVTASMNGRAGAHLRKQYEYLRQWAADIASGRAPLDGRATLRATWYIQAARQFHERESGIARQLRGFDEVKSVRNARDSCQSDAVASGCIEQERKGWQPPDEYVYPGDRVCRSACKCFSLWRNSTTGEIAG